MPIERIVRPFQTQDVTPARRIPSTFASQPKNTILTPGKGGSGKSLSGSVSITTTLYMDTKLKEQALQSSAFASPP
jgi:hypothetical protein